MLLNVDPKVDYAFNRFLGREGTEPILVDVINRIRESPPGQRIQSIELVNPFNPKETPDDKLSIVDVKARDESGCLYNVEMQVFAPITYPERIVYYATRILQQQLRSGENYAELKPTISISFLANERFSQVEDYHLRFALLEQKHYFRLTNLLEFHFLELPRFKKTLAELDPNSLDIWLYFLCYGAKIDMDAVPEVLRQPMLLRAMEELRMMTQSEIERERYEARRKAQMDQDWIMRSMKEEGVAMRAQGLAEGRAEGRAEGEKDEAGRTVQRLERLLKQPQTPLENLMVMSLADLKRMADELEKQLENRQ